MGCTTDARTRAPASAHDLPDGPRILFASPTIPIPRSDVREDGIDFFYYRNTIGQRAYQLRQMQSWHPLHLLAQNLPVESVVLENPTGRRFQEEVDRGTYDVVALCFTVASTVRTLETIRWLRNAHPEVEIILGGYGTCVFTEPTAAARELQSSVQGICRGDGLAFMRRYLAQRWGVVGSPPMRQQFTPTRVSLFRTRLPLARQLCFLYSLGCWHRCAFCATSSQLGHRKQHILTPRQLHTMLLEESERHPTAESAIIYDEDFLADRARVLELIRIMDADPRTRRRPVLLTVFSSVRSVSQYSTSELLRCGIGLIFIGVETFRDDVLDAETPGKRRGEDVRALFERLHGVGIHTLGSLIIGWDAHTEANVRDEVRAFVELNPTVYQVMPLQAPPGSPLWYRMREEGRLTSVESRSDVGVLQPTFRYAHLSHSRVLDLIDEAHAALVSAGGPAVFKMFENLSLAVEHLRDLEGEEHAERATTYERLLPRYFILAFATRLLFHGSRFRRRWRHVFGRRFARRPMQSGLLAALSLAVFPLLQLYSALGRLHHALSRHGDQPETMRREYAPAVEPQADVRPRGPAARRSPDSAAPGSSSPPGREARPRPESASR